MSELYYSVDLTWYNLKMEDSLFVEGWLAAPVGEPCVLSVHNQAGEQLPARVTWKERPDIREARPDIRVPELPGFNLQLPGVSRWLDSVKYLEICADCGGESRTIARLEAAQLRRTVADGTILYKIDILQLLETELVLQGWFIDQQGLDKIQVLDGRKRRLPCGLKRMEREDVSDIYREYVEPGGKIGFSLRIPRKAIRTRRVRILFRSRYVSRTYRGDMRELERQNTRAGRLYNVLRPGRFSENMDYIREHGFEEFREYVRKSVYEEYATYSLWMRNHQMTRQEIRAQREQVLSLQPKISIVIPLYNTPIKYLRQVLDSIRGQTYQDWELCLADGSPEDEIGKYIRRRYGGDERVRYRRLRENLGISGNTNAALAMASGDYIMLADHDDIVEQGALFEIARAIAENPDLDILYTDEDKITMDGKRYFEPNFKPDYNPFMLEGNNYICHIFVVRASIMREIGGFRRDFDGAQDYDLILRCCERTRPERIAHIPRILYHWRSHAQSTAANPESKRYAYEAGVRALEEHFARTGVDASVEIAQNLGFYRVHCPVKGNPKVSVIIPNKDHAEDLEKCLSSLTEKTAYQNYEVLVVENNSEEQATFTYYREMERRYPRCRLLKWEREFNYAAINNYAAGKACGDYLLFLNNDVEITDGAWMEELLGYCQREKVAAVGAKLLYPDDTVQHVGVVVGLGGVAAHAYSGIERHRTGYMGRAIVAQNISAVTAACMLIRHEVFDEVGGFDEGFRVAYNDVDLCMKVTAAGYQIVENPRAVLYHWESKTRGPEEGEEKQERFAREAARFREKWPKIMEEGDPYFNPNLYELYWKIPRE